MENPSYIKEKELLSYTYAKIRVRNVGLSSNTFHTKAETAEKNVSQQSASLVWETNYILGVFLIFLFLFL